MPDWRRTLSQLTADIGDEVQAHVRAARDALGTRFQEAPHAVAAYHGYGTATRWHVLGRALRAGPLAQAKAEDSAWRNLLSMFHRLESDPIPAAQVLVRAAGAERTVVADDEGFVHAWLTPKDSSISGWATAELELISPRGVEPARATARIRIPGASARFVVVSDIDDTVLQSHIGNLVGAVRTTLLSNARTRLPFPGVAAFYRALEGGATHREQNPVFYLSSSPWNLFDLLAEFMEVQRLPAGPLLLRDWDFGLDALGGSTLESYKEIRLQELFALYPSLPFILVGDTSQRDPEIYARAVHAHPDRVLAVYIRDVTRTPARAEAVAALSRELQKARVPLVLSPDTIGAAEHAAARGWIDPATLGEIRDDAAKDEGTRPGKAEP